MGCSRAAFVGAALTLCLSGVATLSAQSPTDLAGSWTLNRQISDLPDQIGFSASFIPFPEANGGPERDGRRGGRERVGSPSPRTAPITAEDSSRIRFLTDEVRLPADQLTIAVTPADVTITPDRGAARTVRPGMRDAELKVGPVTVVTNATWDANHLVIVYNAGPGRSLRYTYAATKSPAQLTVDVEFIEQRSGDKVRRVYEPTPPQVPSSTATPSPTERPLEGLQPGSRPAVSSAPASAAVDQHPDAALKGLNRLGVVVEGIDSEAAKCNLKQTPFETAITKRLTDAGLRVVRDSDDDTYLYVNINTVTAASGLCVSRYDVTLYSHAAAPLTHTASPVPVQVELLHRGGLAGGSPAVLADSVLKSVIENIDLFTARVKSANHP